jgi:DNA-binding CsgD family transcriptional regulator
MQRIREATAYRMRRHLTPREMQALRLVAHGLVYKQVADRMGISIRTVECNMLRSRRKLGAFTAAHAVFIATQLNLFEDAGPDRRFKS